VGGKRRLAKHIIGAFPPHKLYVEVFGGSGAILFAKDPSPIEIYNDFDSSLFNVFQCVKDREKMEQMRDILSLKLYGKEESRLSFIEKDNEEDPVKRAAAWLHCLMTVYGNKIATGVNWSMSLNKNQTTHNVPTRVLAYLAMIDRLPEIHSRLRTVQIENASFETLIPQYDAEDAVFYVDPPYVTETRDEKLYTKELRQRDHHNLLRLLLDLKGSAVYSGYVHPTMRILETNGWTRKDIDVISPLTNPLIFGEQRGKTESIWISPRLSFSD
jgi:DNA adenine methylase